MQKEQEHHFFPILHVKSNGFGNQSDLFVLSKKGFSRKMQLVEQTTWCLTCFITFLESKTLKTLILDRFVSENTIKQMLLQHFAFWEN